MRFFLGALPLAVFLAIMAPSQTAPTFTITGPTGTVAPGSTVTLTLNLTGSASTGCTAAGAGTGPCIAGIQMNVSYPAGVTGVTGAAGAATTAAMDTLTCGSPAAAGQLVCIATGLNQNVFSDGVIATITSKLPATPGTFSYTVVPIFASLPGRGVTVAAPAPFVITSPSPCAVTGDITPSSADVTAILTAITTATTTPAMDLIGDAHIDVRDARRIINALATPQGVASCVTGP